MSEKTCLLVVEPDGKFVKVLQLYFRGTEFEPSVYPDQESALEGAKTSQPAVALLALDNRHPDVGEELRRFTTGIGCPVVVMSQHGDDQKLVTGGVTEFGAAGYLKKPFIKKAGIAALERALGRPVEVGLPTDFHTGPFPVAWIPVSFLLAIPLTIYVLSAWPEADRFGTFTWVLGISMAGLLPLGFVVMGIVFPRRRLARGRRRSFVLLLGWQVVPAGCRDHRPVWHRHYAVQVSLALLADRSATPN